MANDDLRQAVAGLRLGSWTEARQRLLPRLVPVERAGPHRLEPHGLEPEHPEPGPSGTRDRGRSRPVVWDVGIDLGAGIGLVDRDLAAAWNRSGADRAAIWATATANLSRHPRPTVMAVDCDQTRLLVAVGDHWTTGWLLLPDRLIDPTTPTHGPGLIPSASAPARSAGAATALLAVAAAPDLVVLSVPSGADPAGPLVELASRLAEGRPDALPLLPLVLARRGCFSGRILE